MQPLALQKILQSTDLIRQHIVLSHHINCPLRLELTTLVVLKQHLFPLSWFRRGLQVCLKIFSLRSLSIHFALSWLKDCLLLTYVWWLQLLLLTPLVC